MRLIDSILNFVAEKLEELSPALKVDTIDVGTKTLPNSGYVAIEKTYTPPEGYKVVAYECNATSFKAAANVYYLPDADRFTGAIWNLGTGGGAIQVTISVILQKI